MAQIIGKRLAKNIFLLVSIFINILEVYGLAEKREGKDNGKKELHIETKRREIFERTFQKNILRKFKVFLASCLLSNFGIKH